METEIVILVSKDVTESDHDTLRSAVAPFADVAAMSHKPMLPDWDTLLAIVKDAGTVAAAANAFFKFGDALLKWREKAGNPKIRLERPNQPTLDLEVASDEEITSWFSTAAESDGGQRA